MNDIKLDQNNYRKHGDKNKRLIKKSLSECGAGRSILLDGDDVLIAGNGVYEQSRELGIRVRVIETDGTELIAIKRTDLKTTDEKRKILALADNHTSDTSEFDYDLLSEVFNAEVLSDWEIETLADTEEPEGDIYTQKIQSPIYEPSNEKPHLSTLIDTNKTEELIKRIEEAEIPIEVKEFLEMAARRHTVFNYSLIADYYAHSGEDIQGLMQDSALVIIDFNKAIEGGFIKLTERIASLYTKDHGEE